MMKEMTGVLPQDVSLAEAKEARFAAHDM